ncbi:MAG: polymer-forming cytoskeletal protein [Gemmatimonadota bacterium]|nr:polymer-forming cytoskeletal protein [Gemmatimonadota bacterium]MDE3174144.1 polymer-forming cytoskeletal protein [Gemmatimonadota bacterium]MDE3214946.1 polymer-forming cytoskeletal protein [Gemmatimonadota bacterium]
MPIFPKRPVDVPDPAPVGYSVLDAQMRVEGDVDTEGALRIDGRVHGNVRSGSTLVLAAGAAITGTVWAREVIIGGTITGNVTATGRVELQQTGAVSGDIETTAIMIQEGGTVDGRMTVHPTTGAGGGRQTAVAAD